ncbi:MAG: lipolytic enzyme, G-D-S-L [Hungatella sp.]|jgi:lysophospholipase L1-like esterase|nr:lipolytic enzyme, G-D-S-L [Hungatella sp.]
MKKHIVCYGDSNTHGYCAETGGRFSEDERWTCLLQSYLGDDFLVLEEGLSGRTTCFDDPIHEGLSGLDHIYPCLMTHEPVDLLIIMLGTNDTKERFGVSPACIALGLKRLIAKAQAADCWRGGTPDILVVTPQNIDPRYADSDVASTMGKGCAEKSAGLGKEFKLIAQSMGCRYLDANVMLSAEPSGIDFMHLTDAGHGQLAAGLAGFILKITKQTD